jgi:hypothetical protein
MNDQIHRDPAAAPRRAIRVLASGLINFDEGRLGLMPVPNRDWTSKAVWIKIMTGDGHLFCSNRRP